MEDVRRQARDMVRVREEGISKQRQVDRLVPVENQWKMNVPVRPKPAPMTLTVFFSVAMLSSPSDKSTTIHGSFQIVP